MVSPNPLGSLSLCLLACCKAVPASHSVASGAFHGQIQVCFGSWAPRVPWLNVPREALACEAQSPRKAVHAPAASPVQHEQFTSVVAEKPSALFACPWSDALKKPMINCSSPGCSRCVADAQLWLKVRWGGGLQPAGLNRLCVTAYLAGHVVPCWRQRSRWDCGHREQRAEGRSSPSSDGYPSKCSAPLGVRGLGIAISGSSLWDFII